MYIWLIYIYSAHIYSAHIYIYTYIYICTIHYISILFYINTSYKYYLYYIMYYINHRHFSKAPPAPCSPPQRWTFRGPGSSAPSAAAAPRPPHRPRARRPSRLPGPGWFYRFTHQKIRENHGKPGGNQENRWKNHGKMWDFLDDLRWFKKTWGPENDWELICVRSVGEVLCV